MRLTPREREILLLVSYDKTNWEIAKELSLSVHTVSRYLRSIRAKLRAKSRLGAVMLGIRYGEITWEEVFKYWMRYT